MVFIMSFQNTFIVEDILQTNGIHSIYKNYFTDDLYNELSKLAVIVVSELYSLNDILLKRNIYFITKIMIF